MAEKNDAAALAAALGQEQETIHVNGEDLVITPLKFGQLPAVFKHLGALVSDGAGNVDIVASILNGGEDVLACLSIAINKPREWFDTISTEDGIKLLTAAVLLNKDLFQKKVWPELERLLGKKPSPSSSPRDTGSPISTTTPVVK